MAPREVWSFFCALSGVIFTLGIFLPKLALFGWIPAFLYFGWKALGPDPK